ncbi:hypothetical protein CIRG_05306 [Coccidioides immitis RMSCC 2394]|uniref:Uncharacterized protein n=1 Tax=Coccidioides immitis RMSCC 2394 TaxID=404692 RepID=A0A0J6YD62_COCIT|nr:hypothetical protein CIRG_05306 [Coccidioides immitis RMSCC 2394]
MAEPRNFSLIQPPTANSPIRVYYREGVREIYILSCDLAICLPLRGKGLTMVLRSERRDIARPQTPLGVKDSWQSPERDEEGQLLREAQGATFHGRPRADGFRPLKRFGAVLTDLALCRPSWVNARPHPSLTLLTLALVRQPGKSSLPPAPPGLVLIEYFGKIQIPS